MIEAECVECGKSFEVPKNFTHSVTATETMIIGLNCEHCNAMNKVTVKVVKVERV